MEHAENGKKLVLAIIQEADYDMVVSALTEHSFYVTQLSSTGGFLKKKNVTIMIGVDDDRLAVIRNRFLGFVFQQYNLIPKLKVVENVELPLLYSGMGSSERRRRALKALDRVGLSDKAGNRPSQLSGGQQQRVSIARALAGDPSVILADEPTGALDSHTGRDVINFLRELNDDGRTIVLITHDNSIALKAKRIVRLSDGRIVYDGDASSPQAVVMPQEED